MWWLSRPPLLSLYSTIQNPKIGGQAGPDTTIYPGGGYIVYVQSVTMASGSWTVPAINCSGVPTGAYQFVSEWVGKRRLPPKSPLLNRSARNEIVAAARLSIYAWYATPKNGDENRISSISVNAGDSMSVE